MTLSFSNLDSGSSTPDELIKGSSSDSPWLQFFQGILLASGARLPQVQTLVEDSQQLRTKSSWGGFYTARHHILLGAALSITGDRSGGGKRTQGRN